MCFLHVYCASGGDSGTILWRRGVVVITTAQLHLIKPELGVWEIRDMEDL